MYKRQEHFRRWGVKPEKQNIATLMAHYRATSENDLFWHVARGRFDLDKLAPAVSPKGKLELPIPLPQPEERPLEEVVAEIRGAQGGALLLGEQERIQYQLLSLIHI